MENKKKIDRRSTISPWRGRRTTSLWWKKNPGPISEIGTTYDLVTPCNEGGMELTI
nr:MAG TPA: hypothetical protein [Caudoviricetes sp.]